MSHDISYSDKFKKNISTLFDEICEMFEEAKDNGIINTSSTMLNIFKLCISKTNGDKMIQKFIRRTNPFWEKIFEKDTEYFQKLALELFQDYEEKGLDHYKKEGEDDTGILDKLGDSHIKNFKTVLAGSYTDDDGEEVKIFDPEREEDIWKIMHACVKISILYIHKHRVMNDKGQYTAECFPEIKVKSEAQRWGVKLPGNMVVKTA